MTREISLITLGASYAQVRVSSLMIARRFVVKGRVQGVGFRYFAVRAARHLGIAGCVRNLPDGSVEAIAEGPASAIAEFRLQLERGPDFSNVTSVDEIETSLTVRYSGFDIVY